MKTAICFSGLPRFIKEGHKMFSKNLIGFEEMDIFFHTWSNPSKGNSEQLSRKDSIEEIHNLYNVVDYIEESQLHDIAPSGISHEEFIHWSMFYSIWSANNLKKQYETKNGMEYDCVIRTRFDCALLDPLNVMEHINDFNFVCTPWIHKHGVIMDWLNFSSSKIMDTHSEVWKNMGSYKNQGVQMNSGEELLTNHLKTNNIGFKSIDVDVKLIRIGDGAKTWINVKQL